MDKSLYENIKRKYGLVASWAIWGEDVTDVEVIDDSLNKLRPEIVLAALNISKEIEIPFGNFHWSKNDKKLGYALKGTFCYGGYLTNVIKRFVEGNSFDLKKSLTQEIEKKHIKLFEQELLDLGCKNKVIIAIGNEAHRILTSHLSSKYKIGRITHYSYRFRGYGIPKIYAQKVKNELDLTINCLTTG